MRVLAFDPGTKVIGYAVLENLSTKCLAINIVATGKLKGTNSHDKGMKEIALLVSVYKPDFLAYEKAGENKLTPVFKRIIANAIQDFNIPCVGYTVPDIRDELFDGNQKKSDTSYTLKERITILKPDVSTHELDALSVALFALNMKLTVQEDQEQVNNGSNFSQLPSTDSSRFTNDDRADLLASTSTRIVIDASIPDS